MVYGAMNRKDWRTIGLDDLGFDPVELSSQLIPALRIGGQRSRPPTGYGESLLENAGERCQRYSRSPMPSETS